MRAQSSLFWLSLLLVLGCLQPAAALSVISNLPPGTDGGSPVSSSSWKAMVFTTGQQDAVVNNVVLGLNPQVQTDVPSSPKVEVAIYSVSGSNPSVQLATTGLQTVNINQLRQTYTFNFNALQLAAGTSYALVVRSDATGIKWGNTASSTPAASNGFSYVGFRLSSDAGGSWSNEANNRNVLEINATLPTATVPVLAGWTLLVMALGLALVALMFHRRPHSV